MNTFIIYVYFWRFEKLLLYTASLISVELKIIQEIITHKKSNYSKKPKCVHANYFIGAS